MSPWAPARMMVAMVLGQGILPPPADFSLKAVMTAMMIHLPMAAVYGRFVDTQKENIQASFLKLLHVN